MTKTRTIWYLVFFVLLIVATVVFSPLGVMFFGLGVLVATWLRSFLTEES